MPRQTLPVDLLLVQSWLDPLDPMRSALEAAGFAPAIERVDIEPALHAALVRGGFDVAVYHPATPGLSRATVQACIDKLRPGLPLVVLLDYRELGRQIAGVLEARRN